MDPLSIELRHGTGFLFTGPVPGTFAFVPSDCVHRDAVGELRIDQQAYFVSGWSRKNFLVNRVESTGSTLFGEQPLYDEATPGLSDFIERLRKLT